MTYENDAVNFAQIMRITWQSCGRATLEKPTIAYWFNKLSKYTFMEVEQSFDNWLKSQTELPTIFDILKMCQHKISVTPRLSSPLAKEDNKKHSQEVVNFINKNLIAKTDYKAWAKKIIANPKNYTEISLRFAKDALRYE